MKKFFSLTLAALMLMSLLAGCGGGTDTPPADEGTQQEGGEAQEIPLCFDYAENSRGLGLADMAKALRTGRAPRESWRQTLHVLEIMQSFEKSSNSGAAVVIESKYERGEPMADGGVHGVLA